MRNTRWFSSTPQREERYCDAGKYTPTPAYTHNRTQTTVQLYLLTHRDLNDIVDISHSTFSNAFSWRKCDSTLNEIAPEEYWWLATIVWACDNPDHKRVVRVNGLKRPMWNGDSHDTHIHTGKRKHCLISPDAACQVEYVALTRYFKKNPDT